MGGGHLALGIDLGGTDTKYGIVDAEGRVVRKGKWPTERELGPEGVLTLVAEHAREMIGGDDVAAVGMGVPGPMSSRLGVVFKAPNLPGWIDIPVQRILEEHLGRPVALNNDANAAAWGEYWAGAGRGSETMILFTLGTGIGGGIVINGELYVGPDDTAAEFGHVVINFDGPLCGCGVRGCVEAYASATGMKRALREALDAGVKTSLTLPNDADSFEAKPVFDAARAGDEFATRLVADVARSLGVVAGSMINIFNPDLIVYSGAIAQAGPILFEPLVRAAQAGSFATPFNRARFVVSELGTDAGIIGAAGLALKKVDAAGAKPAL